MTMTAHTTTPGTPRTSGPQPLATVRRLAGGVIAGSVAGLGMYVTLAAVAIAQGRGVTYPLHAVQALMSGARVLPDYPRHALYEPQALDLVMAPIYFFVPAIAVGVATAWWLGRRARRGVPDHRWSAAAPAVALTALLFVAFVVGIGFREVSPVAQRVSSGFGVRELGLAAWVTGHVVYAVLLTSLIGPVTRLVVARRTRRNESPGALRGE